MSWMFGAVTAAPFAVSALLGGCTGDDSASSSAASTASSSDAGRALASDAGAGFVAADASQEASACPSGQASCGGVCVSTSKDRDNCGVCGKSCASGEVCSRGACATSCGGGTTQCGDSCVELAVDPDNCGTCGNACTGGKVCLDGHCGISCPSGQIECGGSCINPMTDRQHCGATLGCGESDAGSDDAGDAGSSAGEACADGLVCSGGTCSATCQDSLTKCGDTCVDEQNDPNHCGSCDACQTDGGGVDVSDCRAGACVVGKCSAGTADCNGSYADGCEIDTQTDPQNCGFCGNVCDHACVAGNCVARAAMTSDYADFVTASQTAGLANVLIPGDSITEADNYGGFYFKLSSGITRVRVAFTGANGSSTVTDWGGGSAGGTGGSGTVDLAASFFTAQSQSGFWIILGQGGQVSAGETTPIASFRAFNGGGAATDWSSGQGTYAWAAGGGGGSDLRFSFDGSTTDPHGGGDPTTSFASRFAVLGGGGGGTTNGGAIGGYGGGFNSNGGNGGYDPHGNGATTTAGGDLDGTLGIGGDGLQDGSEGWAGGGGGGYYGGGAPTAHGGGGGGSGYLTSADGVTQVSTSDGTAGGNAASPTHGSFTVSAY